MYLFIFLSFILLHSRPINKIKKKKLLHFFVVSFKFLSHILLDNLEKYFKETKNKKSKKKKKKLYKQIIFVNISISKFHFILYHYNYISALVIYMHISIFLKHNQNMLLH